MRHSLACVVSELADALKDHAVDIGNIGFVALVAAEIADICHPYSYVDRLVVVCVQAVYCDPIYPIRDDVVASRCPNTRPSVVRSLDAIG